MLGNNLNPDPHKNTPWSDSPDHNQARPDEVTPEPQGPHLNEPPALEDHTVQFVRNHTVHSPLNSTPRVNADVVPGFTPDEWKALSTPSDKVVDTATWATLTLAERLVLERAAVREYLQQKSPEYQAMLNDVAAQMSPMPASVCMQIVMGAYNEQDGIAKTLDELARRTRETFGEVAEEQRVGVTIVVNRPVTNDAARERADSSNLEKTVEIINQKKQEYQHLQLDAVVLEAPEDIAGIGLARMIGHDLTALRSISSSQQERTLPYFIQTADADMTHMSDNYFEDIFKELTRTDFRHDVYREAPCYPVEEIIRHPLLDILDIFWTHSTRAMAENTENAWTAGAGILVSLYSHVEGGGVFPFKFESGVDEDLRIGYHARAIRPGMDNMGQIEPILFETDPRRFILVAKDMMLKMKRDRLEEDPNEPLKKDYRLTATGLKTYLDFHSVLIRTESAPTQEDATWLFNPTEFAKALPIRALEMVANSYRELIREQLGLYRAKNFVPAVKESFARFVRGEHANYMAEVAYAEAEEQFTNRIRAEIPEPEFKRMLEDFEQMLKEISQQATDITLAILQQHGIECEAVACDHLPTGASEESEIPWAVKITNVDAYRERLKAKVPGPRA